MAEQAERLGRTWDAIVVGSGASGGVAAMTLSEGGARVLLIEAGPDLTRPAAVGDAVGNMVRRLAGVSSGRHRRQAQHPGYWKANPRLYIDECLHPYEHPRERPFLWTRGHQVGGRSLTWGGITLRLSDQDFEGVTVDGERISWPISHQDLRDHYAVLERDLGVHGDRDGLEQLPDGETVAPLPLTAAEARFAEAVREQLGHDVIHSRGFPAPASTRDGVWPRSSSLGSTLPRAYATGRVTLLSHHKVDHITMATGGDWATGVIAVDLSNGDRRRLEADCVVLCASTIQSVSVLLRSTEQQQPGGLVDPSGRLGTRLMDHVSTSRFFALPGGTDHPQPPLSGAGSFFLPFGRQLKQADFQGGYGLWGGIGRFDPPNWLKRIPDSTTGFLIGHGEVLPQRSNRISVSTTSDQWGIALPHIDCQWSANEQAMVEHMQRTIGQCIDAAGAGALPIRDLFRIPLIEPLLEGAVALSEAAAPPGYYIHELGGAPMGASETTSVVDTNNRLWRVPNVLVVDGACWPTSSWQSPTLTMMAISRRACGIQLSSPAERRGR